MSIPPDLLAPPIAPPRTCGRPGPNPRRPAPEARPIRVARGNQVMGKWSYAEIQACLGNEDLHFTDSFYDEDISAWLPLSALKPQPASGDVVKLVKRLCYCGTGLPFHLCCGDGSQY